MKRALFTGSLLFLTGASLQPLATPVVAQASQNQSPVLIAQRATASTPQVALLSAGAQPRQQIRLKPTVNSRQAATMTMNMNVAVTGPNGQALPATKLPSVVMGMETVVSRIDPNGDIHYRFRYTDANVSGDSSLPPAAQTQLRSQLQKLKGLSGSFVIDNRGRAKSSNLTIPTTVDATTKQMLQQMSQSLQQFASPFPDAPIGPGAKWRVTYPVISAGGIRSSMVANYELTALNGNTATLDFTVEQRAPAQKLNQPGMPRGVSLNLKSLGSRGRGQLTMQLDRLLPISSAMSLRSLTHMQTQTAAGSQPIDINTDSTVEVVLESSR